MRTRHTPHALPGFPVFSGAFVADDRLVLGGGGGSSRSGVKNKLRLYGVSSNEKLELLKELELEKEEDSPMSMAADVFAARVVCGINSPVEQLEKGLNKNCRLYDTTADEISLLESTGTLDVSGENSNDFQKVTVLSPGRDLVCVAGTKKVSLLTYPSLSKAANDIVYTSEIYDASFSSTKLAVVTTDALELYTLPGSETSDSGASTGPRTRNKAKRSAQLQGLKKLSSLARPEVPGAKGDNTTFRACRFNPVSEDTFYTASNTTPTRTKGKVKPKQGFIVKWETTDWKVAKVRKVGEKGITCFDVSLDGRYLAVGTADCAISILDAKTLSPLLSILKSHDFPPTIIKFNPSASLLASGSADNSLRLVTVPDGLSRTQWTYLDIILVIMALLVSVYAVYTNL